MIRIRRRRTVATGEGRNLVVLQVAAILIAIGAVMKLYMMQSQRADGRAFRRIRSEIDELDISSDGKDTLRDVTNLASELTRDARGESSVPAN
jgi:hypothetical protein